MFEEKQFLLIKFYVIFYEVMNLLKWNFNLTEFDKVKLTLVWAFHLFYKFI